MLEILRRPAAKWSTVAVLGTSALAGCPSGGGNPCPPGERLGAVRVDTDPEGVEVRLRSQVVATRPEYVEQLKPSEKTGAAPQETAVCYKPGLGTVLSVHGYPAEPVSEGGRFTLSCVPLSDGIEQSSLGDEYLVTEENQKTAFVFCSFSEGLADQYQ